MLLGRGTALYPQDEVGRAKLPPAAGVQVNFQRDIAPLLEQKCLLCHGPKQQMGGLRLDRPKDAMAGGYSGPAILPGKSSQSKLIHLVTGLNQDLIMPMAGERLTAEQVGLLRAWIDQGAHWDGQEALAQEKTKLARHSHWAFNPPEKPPIPKIKKQATVQNPIDAFVLAKLDAEGIEPSPEADRTTLIRRLSLDLTGLLPRVEEIHRYLADKNPDAYERWIDRLLASPHYGEKWARHWLDLARYADSDGYEKDWARPHAWRWRDWVIKSLNRNMPFDEFTIQQIAGDLLPSSTLEQKVATGFNRNTLTNREGGVSLEQFRIEQVMDRTETLGSVWLGLTVGCARCHDHKFDPFTQKDYYQIFAFFNSVREVNIEAPLPGEMGPYLSGRPTFEKNRAALLEEYGVRKLQAEWERKSLWAAKNPGLNVRYDISWDTIGKMLDHGHEIIRKSPSQRTPKERGKLTDHFVRWYDFAEGKERYEEVKFKELREKLQKLAQEYPGLTEAPTLADNPTPPKSHILIRGDYLQPGIAISPRTPAVLSPMPDGPEPPRLRLARWIVSRENPLSARVAVNRIWQEYFGKGLVETSEDFGSRGSPPTHPELLDWLAVEFMDSGWNLKHIHKLIVTSATYRQSSVARKDLKARDPSNELLARQVRLRLSAELVRDAALAASGLLDTRIGGKSVHPPLPPGVADLGYDKKIAWTASGGNDRYRRGLYIFFQRTTPYPQLVTFDAPDSLLACSRRERSTTPLQALNLLNDSVFFEAARGLAARIMREKSGSLQERLHHAFLLCLARAPGADERERLIRFYHQQKKLLSQDPATAQALFPANEVEGIDAAEAAVWVNLSRVLLNLDEFITRE